MVRRICVVYVDPGDPDDNRKNGAVTKEQNDRIKPAPVGRVWKPDSHRWRRRKPPHVFSDSLSFQDAVINSIDGPACGCAVSIRSSWVYRPDRIVDERLHRSAKPGWWYGYLDRRRTASFPLNKPVSITCPRKLVRGQFFYSRHPCCGS
jgi:hypothetical protein